MRAAVYRKFGDPEVVKIETVAKPSPKPDEVLVKIKTTTVSVADHRLRAKDLPKGLWFFAPLVLGVFAPRIKVLGMDFAGVVEKVGDAVTRFKPGDEVFAMSGAKFGGHAEFACIAEDAAIALKPQSLNFEEAVSVVFGGMTALAYLGRAKIKKGDEVLVNGASGSVGSAAVQIAKHMGAIVTAVSSAGNHQMVRDLGATHTIDYKQEDFTKNGKTYHAIVDCVGNATFDRTEHSIKPGGSLLLVILDLKSMLFAKRWSKKSGKLVSVEDWKQTQEALTYLAELADQGVVTPVIDSTYDFENIVEAHRRTDTGRKRGNVVVRVI